jgi:hypothetical protein
MDELPSIQKMDWFTQGSSLSFSNKIAAIKNLPDLYED